MLVLGGVDRAHATGPTNNVCARCACWFFARESDGTAGEALLVLSRFSGVQLRHAGSTVIFCTFTFVGGQTSFIAGDANDVLSISSFNHRMHNCEHNVG